MIQDIAPLHLYNEWHNVQPEKDDWVICSRNGKYWCVAYRMPFVSTICGNKIAGTERRSFCISVCCWGGAFFSLSAASVQRTGRIESDASLSWSVENQRKNSVAEQTLLSEEEIVFHYETTRYLRGAAPQHMCYAGLVGAQLAGWYAAHRFCGGCGTRMIPDGRERMMRCPACGQMEYPKICPCVIVGVMHEGKILVSWYKNGFRDHYALNRGFAEIGETIEETCCPGSI